MSYVSSLLKLALEFIFRCLSSNTRQYQDLKLNSFKNSSQHYICQPTRPSPGALKFGETTVPSALVQLMLFMFTMFLNGVNVFLLLCHMYFLHVV
jgi:hypothetical protein